MNESLFLKILTSVVTAAVAATIINLLIALIASLLLRAPRTFAPFTFLPIISGCFGGAVLAGLFYYALHLLFDRPQIAFLVAASIALLLSFHLPFRLTNHRSPRFAGATRRIQLTLCLMHTVVAVTSVCFVLQSDDRLF